jgi:hypothetical protein
LLELPPNLSLPSYVYRLSCIARSYFSQPMLMDFDHGCPSPLRSLTLMYVLSLITSFHALFSTFFPEWGELITSSFQRSWLKSISKPSTSMIRPHPHPAHRPRSQVDLKARSRFSGESTRRRFDPFRPRRFVGMEMKRLILVCLVDIALSMASRDGTKA